MVNREISQMHLKDGSNYYHKVSVELLGPYWRLLELEPLGIKMAPGVRAGKEDGSAEIFFNR